MQTGINDTFPFSCKRFIPVSKEIVLNFLSYPNFFTNALLLPIPLWIWSENGCGKSHFWIEIGSGFGEAGGTHPHLEFPGVSPSPGVSPYPSDSVRNHQDNNVF